MSAADRRFFHGLDVTVYCSATGFEDVPAVYKIAAEWLAGGTRELKTFGFANDSCLEIVYREAEKKAAAILPVSGEVIGPMGVFRLLPNARDRDLERLPELEQRLRGV
jgi:hypothetical protein